MAVAPLPPVSPTPTSAAVAPPMSEGARIINTFVAPSKTFTDLRRSAAWWGPWIVISIFSLIFIYSIGKQVGFEQVSKNQIAALQARRSIRQTATRSAGKTIASFHQDHRILCLWQSGTDPVVLPDLHACAVGDFQVGASARDLVRASLCHRDVRRTSRSHRSNPWHHCFVRGRKPGRFRHQQSRRAPILPTISIRTRPASLCAAWHRHWM